MGEFNHRDSLWPEEEKEGHDPQPHRNSTVGSDRRHYVEIENSDDEQ
jgi:hypothetical protein